MWPFRNYASKRPPHFKKKTNMLPSVHTPRLSVELRLEEQLKQSSMDEGDALSLRHEHKRKPKKKKKKKKKNASTNRRHVYRSRMKLHDPSQKNKKKNRSGAQTHRPFGSHTGSNESMHHTNGASTSRGRTKRTTKSSKERKQQQPQNSSGFFAATSYLERLKVSAQTIAKSRDADSGSAQRSRPPRRAQQHKDQQQKQHTWWHNYEELDQQGIFSFGTRLHFAFPSLAIDILTKEPAKTTLSEAELRTMDRRARLWEQKKVMYEKALQRRGVSTKPHLAHHQSATHNNQHQAESHQQQQQQQQQPRIQTQRPHGTNMAHTFERQRQ